VVNAVLDDGDLVVVVVVDLVFVEVAGADVAGAPPQAARITPERATASTASGTERWPPRRLTASVRFVIATVWKANLDAG